MEQASLVCPKCRRGLTLNIEALARRRACNYCGAALEIPPELSARLAALLAAKKPSSAPAVATGCPVCGRGVKVPGEKAGKPAQCGYCGAKFLAPAASGPGLDLRVAEGTPAVALEAAVAKPASDNPLTTLAWRALAARWPAGTVTKDEAAGIMACLDALAEWKPTGPEVSPLPPHLTTQIAQYLVLRLPNASAILEPSGSAILQIPLPGGKDIGGGGGVGSQVGELVALNAIGLGLLMATGTGFIATPKFGKDGGGKDEQDRVQVNPAIWLRLLPGEKGATLLEGEYQDNYGDRAPLDWEKLSKLAAVIRDGFAVPARAYLAFRALYGDWATPAIYTAASRDKVQARIAALPGFEAGAEELSAALLMPAKKAKPQSAPEV